MPNTKGSTIWNSTPNKKRARVRKRTVKRTVNQGRTPAQERATRKLVALNRKRARNNRSMRNAIRKTASNRRRTTQGPTRASNPIRYVIQAVNVKTGATGWFTGDTIDDDLKKARTYKQVRGATIVAKQLFKTLPNTWRLLVLHEHRP